MFYHISRDLFPEFFHKKRPFRSRSHQTRLVVDVTSLGLGKTVKVGELSYEGLELINAKEAVVCAVKLTRAARGAAATAGK